MIHINLSENKVQFTLSDSKNKGDEAKYLENALTGKGWFNRIDYTVRRSFNDVYSVEAGKFENLEDITKMFKEPCIGSENRKDASFFKGPQIPYKLTLENAEAIENEIIACHAKLKR